MDIFDSNMPKHAFFIPSGTVSTRIPFRCRLETDGAQFYTRNIGGLLDTGTNAVIVTKKELEYQTGAKVIIDDILYSVISITPFIPDTVAQGIYKRKAKTQYVIQLG